MAWLRHRLGDVLPHGNTLPARAFRRRHRALLALVFAHAVALPAVALAHGLGTAHAVSAGAIVAAFGFAGLLARRHRRLAASLVASGLLASSALLVHVTGGLIEAHFHPFVVIVLLALYEDWLPFSLAVAGVAAHHGILGGLEPRAVFDHPDALAHPLRWAGIHAGFVAAAGVAAVMTWRLNEDVRREAAASLARAVRAERETRLVADELERSNRDLARFASVASHDLSEPLRTVTGFLQLLEARCAARLGDDGGEFVRHALDGSRRMQRLIDDLLELSRVGRGTLPTDAVDLHLVVDGALADLGDAVQRTGARIDVGDLPVVRGDARQLQQLLQNLLSNALKFSAGRPHVQLSARPDGASWVVSVVDDGIGIDPRHAERVFQPFQRLASVAGRVEGTGIGLAVCRRIVERHGGRVWAEPAAGGGSAFRIQLAAVPERPSSPSPEKRYSATMPS